MSGLWGVLMDLDKTGCHWLCSAKDPPPPPRMPGRDSNSERWEALRTTYRHPILAFARFAIFCLLPTKKILFQICFLLMNFTYPVRVPPYTLTFKISIYEKTGKYKILYLLRLHDFQSCTPPPPPPQPLSEKDESKQYFAKINSAQGKGFLVSSPRTAQEEKEYS